MVSLLLDCDCDPTFRARYVNTYHMRIFTYYNYTTKL
jgi:hypothetical protein